MVNDNILIMNKIYKYFGLVFCAVAVWACAEEIEVPAGGSGEYRTAKVSLDLSVLSEEVGYSDGLGATKADGEPDGGSGAGGATEPEIVVEKFWFVQYDNEGNIMGDPVYYTSSDEVVVFLPDDDTKPCEGIIVAMTSEAGIADDFFEGKVCSTKAELLDLSYGLTSEQAAAEPEGGFYVYGNLEITTTTADSSDPVECLLKRNVARLKVKVNHLCPVPSFRIQSIYVHNVPKEYHYVVGDEPVEYVSYDVSPEVALEKDGSHEFTLYIPQNLQDAVGDISGATEMTKNEFAPGRATYIEIIGSDETYYLHFRVYPGADMETDFNLEPNHSYELNVDVKSYFSESDKRVARVKKQEILKPANSYIINPESIETVYAVPMAWMFRYWNSVDGYAADRIDFSAAENRELIAEVIWQEQDSRVVTFCDEKGTSKDDSAAFEVNPSSDDKGYVYFRFRTDSKVYGNVLIGVKSASDVDKYDSYLWSWHLWITDYDPDEQTAGWTAGQYVYPVTGGEVHRYDDGNDNDVWANEYYNKYIMDRNLGALSAKKTDGLAKTGGLYYQFGRKDPFPRMYSDYQLYGIGGSGSSVRFTQYSSGTDVDVIGRTEGRVSIDVSIRNPHTFHHPQDDEGDWVSSPNPYVDNPWNNPAGNTYVKGIFDPCPPGWKVPADGTWNNFEKDTPTVPNGRLSETVDQSGFSFYISAQGSGVTAYYPTPGSRAAASGAVAGYDLSAYVKSSTPNSGSLGLSLHFYKNFASPRQTNYRSSGSLVRCIQE